MNFKEYQEQAKRTCPDLGGDKINLPHMVLGMNSEMYELEYAIKKDDKVNIAEEIADNFWYLANYCTFRVIPFDIFQDWFFKSGKRIGVKKAVKRLYKHNSKLQDIVKKNMAYGKLINGTDEYEILENIIINLSEIVDDLNIDIYEALDKNINKLKLRFPDKFDADRAINRDHDAERVVLEK